MVEILSLVLHHEEHLVEQAIDMALEAGKTSKQQVMNCLSRLYQIEPHEPVPVETALKLHTEPTSDTARYDNLRGQRHAH